MALSVEWPFTTWWTIVVMTLFSSLNMNKSDIIGFFEYWLGIISTTINSSTLRVPRKWAHRNGKTILIYTTIFYRYCRSIRGMTIMNSKNKSDNWNILYSLIMFISHVCVVLEVFFLFLIRVTYFILPIFLFF